MPLKEYAGVEPLYGIKTGFNEAFLIDAATRDRLIAQEPEAESFIRPYLRGQDISRWSSLDSGLFMIVMKSSGDHPWPRADAPDEAEAERRFKKAYPDADALVDAFRESQPRKRKLTAAQIAELKREHASSRRARRGTGSSPWSGASPTSSTPPTASPPTRWP